MRLRQELMVTRLIAVGAMFAAVAPWVLGTGQPEAEHVESVLLVGGIEGLIGLDARGPTLLTVAAGENRSIVSAGESGAKVSLQYGGVTMVELSAGKFGGGVTVYGADGKKYHSLGAAMLTHGEKP